MLVVENGHHDGSKLRIRHVGLSAVVVFLGNGEDSGSVACNSGTKIGAYVAARAFEIWSNPRADTRRELAWSWQWLVAEREQQRCRRNDNCVRPGASARRQDTALPWYNLLISIAQ